MKLFYSLFIYLLLTSISDIYASMLNIDDRELQTNPLHLEIEDSLPDRENRIFDASNGFSTHNNYRKLDIRETSDETVPLVDISYIDAIKKTVSFCTPNIFASLTQVVSGIWYSHLYGALGGDALSSESVALLWNHLIITAAIGGLKTTLIITGKLNGFDDPALSTTIGNVNKSALVLMIFYSLLTLPLTLEAGNIVKSIGIINNPEILEQIQKYSNGFAWGIPAMLFLNNDILFSLALNDNYIPLIYGCIQTSLAGFLAYPLTLGKWGAPKLGVEGMGHAISAGAWLTWFILRTYYMSSEKYIPYKLLDFYSLRWKHLRKYMSYAVPLAASDSVALTQSFFYTQLITGAGVKVAQAYSSSSSFFKQLNSALWSCSSSINALIANNASKKNIMKQDATNQIAFKNCKRLVASSVTAALSFAAIASIPALVWQDSFISYFGGQNLSEATIKLARLYLLYNFGNTLLNGYLAAIEASLFGLEDVKGPIFIDLTVDFITILTAALAAGYSDNPNLIVAASLLANAAGAIMYSVRLKHMSKYFLRENSLNAESTHRDYGKYSRSDDSLEYSFG